MVCRFQQSGEVPVKSRLKSRHVSPSISWVVLMLKAVLVRLSHLLPISPPFPGIPSCCGNSCLFRFPSGGKLPAQAEENLLAWCEGLLWIPLQVIINLFISLWHGYRAHYGVSPQFSLSLLLPPCSLSSDILYYIHTHTHTLTFLITVITKRWNEVIFLFPNNRLSKQQMNLLPPAMRNRHIIFKFQFILSRRLLSCGAATHTIVFLNIVSNQAVRRRRSLSEGSYFSSVVASVGECGWITFRWTLAGVFTDCARMGVELAGPPCGVLDLLCCLGSGLYIASFLVIVLLILQE